MAKRRGNGEGSVYRRGDGRVVGEYEDANSRRRYVSGKTKAEVRQKLRKLLADRDEGIAYDSANLTAGAYLDKWLEAIKGSVRERTWQRHEQVVRLHLKPTIGGVRLDRLSALQVQAVYGRKLDAGLKRLPIIHTQDKHSPSLYKPATGCCETCGSERRTYFISSYRQSGEES